MISNGLKTHFNGMLTPFWPILAGSPLHFGAPEAFWGSKMGPELPKRGQKWPKMAPNGQNLEKFSIFSFGWKCTIMVSNGLKRSQNTF